MEPTKQVPDARSLELTNDSVDALLGNLRCLIPAIRLGSHPINLDENIGMFSQSLEHLEEWKQTLSGDLQADKRYTNEMFPVFGCWKEFVSCLSSKAGAQRLTML